MKNRSKILTVLIFCFSFIIFSSCKQENEPLKQDLFQLSEPEILAPNQLNILSTEIENGCEFILQNSTSNPFDKMLMPDPTLPLCPGCAYEYNGIVEGSYAELFNDLGGKITLIIRSGPFSASLEVNNNRAAILEGITQLQMLLPEDHTQSVDVKVKEGWSAKSLGAEIGFFSHGLFHDFSFGLNFNSTNNKKTYSAVVSVTDFTIEVEYPGKSNLISSWYPKMSDKDLADLEEQPIFVKSINFGKALFMNIESSLSAFEIQGKLNASFGFIWKDEFDLAAGYQSLKANSSISIKTVGGTVQGVTQTLTGEEGPLISYLNSMTQDTKGSTAEAIFVQLGFLNDGSNARVVLATDDYIVRDCGEPCPTVIEEIPAVGGNGGDPFYASFSECAKIETIQVRSGSRIDKIIIKYRDKEGNLKTVEYGGNGGDMNPTVYVTSDIVKVTGRAGSRLYGIQFHFADGTSSPHFGDTSGGNYFEMSVDNFGGFYGRSKTEIDAFGILNKTF